MIGTVRRLLLAAAMMALASGGCATARAKTPVAPTPLDVPAPPPRIIVPPDPEPTPPPAPVAEAVPKPQTPARRPPAPRPDTKIDPPRPADPPIVTAATPAPAATLQQSLPTSASEAARRVREQLARAKEDLKRVNPGALGPDAKSQYDTASRFVAQADQALREGNLVFAAKVAEKAAGLAASLPVR
jgi:2-oxoglutarate dehydrogenase E2 component (dihydrolipoamide succinyltransferase)